MDESQNTYDFLGKKIVDFLTVNCTVVSATLLLLLENGCDFRPRHTLRLAIKSSESAFALISTKNTDSAHFQGRKSANHGLPAHLRMPRHLKQLWLSTVTKMDLHYDCA